MAVYKSPLKRILAEKHLTLKKLGDLSGVSSRSLEPYMAGKKSFAVASTETSLKVADALGIDIHELI